MTKEQMKQIKAKPGRFDATMIALLIGVGLLSAGLGYGLGWLQGDSKVNDTMQIVETERTSGATKLQDLERRLSAELQEVREHAKAQLNEAHREHNELSHRATLLESRRQLSQVLINLDNRNFGTAQQHLDQASRLLTEAGGDDPELSALNKNLEEARVVVAGNFQSQRTSFGAYANRFDAFFDRATHDSAGVH